MANYYLAQCYWRDNLSEFEGIFKDTDDVIEEEDDNVFFYGMSKEAMDKDIADKGEDSMLDFVIVSYEKIEPENTYDVHFNDDTSSNNLGFTTSLEHCLDYIEMHNGSSNSYFGDYKGGTVSVVCNETGQTITEIKIN